MNYGTTELSTAKGKESRSYTPTFGLDEHTI